jgi:hypothetical protein
MNTKNIYKYINKYNYKNIIMQQIQEKINTWLLINNDIKNYEYRTGKLLSRNL